MRVRRGLEGQEGGAALALEEGGAVLEGCNGPGYGLGCGQGHLECYAKCQNANGPRRTCRPFGGGGGPKLLRSWCLCVVGVVRPFEHMHFRLVPLQCTSLGPTPR